MTEGVVPGGALHGLTLEEKASLCSGSDAWHTQAVGDIPAIRLADGPHGLRAPADAGSAFGPSRPATCFPTAAALGSSWDPTLLRAVGEAIGREARAAGVAVVLGPGINIKRSPLCGRNFEYLSEDPLVTGILAAAMVDGIQSCGVGASLKHFAVNNQETDRLRVSAEVDERTLREIYLSAFERVVTDARPWTVMCAYNRVNGIPASEHRWLLTTVLRDEWGFDGVVVSDWGAVRDRPAALAAGLDLQMPADGGAGDAALVAAVRAGELPEAALDTAAARVIGLARKAAPAPGDAVDEDAHHRLARAAACDSAVLLKNDGGILPLHPVPGDRIAVIGDGARHPRYQGAGSSQVQPTRLDDALDALRATVPAGVEVAYAPGPDGPGVGDVTGQAAAGAAAVVVFAGLPEGEESEGFDRRHMDLPADQLALISRLAAINDRLVVVLANGAAVTVAGWQHHAAAVLECWLPGQAGGSAVADLLLGRAAPSGRLAETLPVRLQDTPAYLNFPGEQGRVRHGEGVFVGYRGYDALDRTVSYPFGHGLTYTTFDYADLAVGVSGRPEDGDLELAVSATVTNTGRRAGKEVVQCYTGAPDGPVRRPPLELRAWRKVPLEPGESATVSFALGARALSYWSVAAPGWVLDPGGYTVAVGASSRDLRLTATVVLDVPPVRAPLGPEATLDEWLDHPDGVRALAELLGTGANGLPMGLGRADLRAVIGNFPLRALAAFPGTGIDLAALDTLMSRVDP